MHSRYRTCFPLQKCEDTVETVAQLCGEWRRTVSPEHAAALATGATIKLSETERIESLLVDRPGGFAWGMRHWIQDENEPTLNWITDVGVQHDACSAWLSVTNYLTSSSDVAATPLYRARTRPRIVRDCLKRLGTPLPVGPNARELRADEAEVKRFVEELLDPARRYPIVFVSCCNIDDRPLTDAAKLADWVSGLASVVVAKNRFPSRRLQDHLPQHLGCWDGAVRIYWPRFQLTDAGEVHRVWAAGSVRDYDRDDSNYELKFKEAILTRICDLTGHQTHREYLDWPTINALANNAKTEAAVAAARGAGDERELVKLFESENKTLVAANEERQYRIEFLESELARERDLAEYWREQSLTKSAPVDVQPAGPESVASVFEAIDWAKKRYPDELVFAFNSKSDEETPYEPPTEVARALEWLATTFLDARTAVRPCPDLKKSIREHCGGAWFWMGGQSDYTVSKYDGDYHCQYAGKRHEVGEHVGTGKSKDPRETIRIGFCYLEDEHKLLIGYVGQHQRTAAT